MTGASRARPPFAETIARLDLPLGAATLAHDATLGRTQLAPGTPATGDDLPELAVDFDPDSRGESDLGVIALAGRGGMGEVWFARQRSLGRDVAIKTIPPGADEATEHALVAEGRVTGALEHPSIVPVHALGRTASRRPALVMKRIEGVSWRELLQSPGHPLWTDLGPEEPLILNVRILMQLCHALELAHRRGFVHRDVKPANVMVGAFGEVYLVDWGVAVRTDQPLLGPHRLAGTPAYMAPEMVAGLPVDARTDVYLLGATLHEVLTGQPPHVGQSIVDVLRSSYESTPRDCGSAPADLADLCRQAMSCAAADRPPSARAFRERLAAFLNHRASAAITWRGLELVAAVEDPTHPARRAALEECLVTLRLALAEWPENREALDALGRCRRAAVGLEVAAGNAAAARDVLEQMENPPPDLCADVAALEDRLARERDEAARGRRAVFEVDRRIGARERLLVGLGMIAVAVLISALTIPASFRGMLEIRHLVGFALGANLVFGLLLTVFRRRVFSNRFSRQTTGVMAVLLALLLMNRGMAWMTSRPVNDTLTGDLLAVAGVCGVAGVLLARWWFVGLGAGLLALCVSFWKPPLAPPAFSSTVLLLAISGIVAWTRDVRRA